MRIPAVFMAANAIRRGYAVLISAQDAQHLASSASTRFLDCSWHLGDPAKAHSEFSSERIPASQLFDVEHVRDVTSPLPHMLPPPDLFKRCVETMGVSSTDDVVLYARKGCFSVPRAWWMFRTFGHPREKLFVIDGGFEAWKRSGGAIETGPPLVPTKGSYVCSFKPENVRSFAQMQTLVRDGSEQVVDTRPAPRFTGAAPEPRPGMARGHMPGAANLPFTELLDKDDFSAFRPVDEMREAFQRAGVRTDRPAVFSCGSGMSACVAAFACELMGTPQDVVYDGSWSEWGAAEGAPTETSAPPL